MDMINCKDFINLNMKPAMISGVTALQSTCHCIYSQFTCFCILLNKVKINDIDL